MVWTHIHVHVSLADATKNGGGFQILSCAHVLCWLLVHVEKCTYSVYKCSSTLANHSLAVFPFCSHSGCMVASLPGSPAFCAISTGMTFDPA